MTKALMCVSARICLLVLLVLPGSVLAQVASHELDPRFQPGRRIEADSVLGRFSLGLSGWKDNERLQATTGDVEFSTLYQVQTPGTFPRVAELRPYFFNRIETSDTGFYESLGIGVGLQAGLRRKYGDNSWFIRGAMLTPTDYYIERYNLDREQSSVLELFAGYEVPLQDRSPGREMRKRVSRPSVIVLGVSPMMFEPGQAINAVLLERTHALMIGAYLSRVWQAEDAGQAGRDETDWPVLRLMERVTGETLSEAQWLVLTTDMFADPQRLATRRREVLAEALRRGLAGMMRGRYPLVFEPIARPQGEAVDPFAGPMPVARAALPGLDRADAEDPLNIDAMIEHYIAYVLARL